MHELEQLHGELDVADAARAPLQLPSGEALAGDLGLHPGLHRPQRAQLVGRERMGPEPALGGVEPAGAEASVATGGPGLQQGLELPRLGPLVPVRLVGVERAHEGPVAALGPEVGVDPEAPPADLHHGSGPALEAGARALAHEQHVDVARVVQLGAAELAHADHGEGDVVAAVAVGGRRQRTGGVEDLVAERGERGPDLLELVASRQVAGRDAEELEVAPRQQRLGGHVADRRAPIEVGQQVRGGVGVGLDRAGEGAAGGHHRHGGGGEARVGGQALDGGGRGVDQVLEPGPHGHGRGAVLHEGLEVGGQSGPGHAGEARPVGRDGSHGRRGGAGPDPP